MKPEENIPLSKCTTFKIGGPARYFFRVKNAEEAGEALGFARRKNLPFFVLGGGSNLLAGDGGFAGVVIKNEISGMSFKESGGDVMAVVGAGESWDDFVAEAVRRGLYGLENLSGIPGTVGAAPIQNIGAYGAEVKDTVVSVSVLDSETNAARIFKNADCRFAYRDSFFKSAEGKRYIITSVSFKLKKNGALNLEYKDLKQIFNFQFSISNGAEREKKLKALTPQEVRKAVIEIRSRKFPDLKTCGTAGSFFKNPIITRVQFDELKKKFPGLPGFEVDQDANFRMSADDAGKKSIKVSLAWILDNICKLNGYQRGNVALFERQPIVIVNTGGADAEKIKNLARDVANLVREKTGIAIEWEVEKL